jgi:hypothetical protein
MERAHWDMSVKQPRLQGLMAEYIAGAVGNDTEALKGLTEVAVLTYSVLESQAQFDLAQAGGPIPAQYSPEQSPTRSYLPKVNEFLGRRVVGQCIATHGAMVDAQGRMAFQQPGLVRLMVDYIVDTGGNDPAKIKGMTDVAALTYTMLNAQAEVDLGVRAIGPTPEGPLAQ